MTETAKEAHYCIQTKSGAELRKVPCFFGGPEVWALYRNGEGVRFLNRFESDFVDSALAAGLAAAPKAEPVPVGEYPPMPWGSDFEEWLEVRSESAVYDAFHAYADADRAMRAKAAPDTPTQALQKFQAIDFINTEEELEEYVAARMLGLQQGYDAARLEVDALRSRQPPAGWVMVPAEPTKEMIEHAHHACDGTYAGDVYRAMLAAAPKAAPDALCRIFLVTEHHARDGKIAPVYGSSLRKVLSGHTTREAAERARTEAEDAYNALYPGYQQCGNPLPKAWVIQEVDVIPPIAARTQTKEGKSHD